MCNLGSALAAQGKLEEAIAAYWQAIGLESDFAEAHYNLGVALNDQGKLEEAIAAYRQAIGIKPDYAEAHYNLGVAEPTKASSRRQLPPFGRRSASSRTMPRLIPTSAVALKDQSKLEEAIAAYRRAIGIKPDYAEAHCNLGNALKDQGKLEEAIAALIGRRSASSRTLPWLIPIWPFV